MFLYIYIYISLSLYIYVHIYIHKYDIHIYIYIYEANITRPLRLLCAFVQPPRLLSVFAWLLQPLGASALHPQPPCASARPRLPRVAAQLRQEAAAASGPLLQPLCASVLLPEPLCAKYRCYQGPQSACKQRMFQRTV